MESKQRKHYTVGFEAQTLKLLTAGQPSRPRPLHQQLSALLVEEPLAKHSGRERRTTSPKRTSWVPCAAKKLPEAGERHFKKPQSFLVPDPSSTSVNDW